MNEGIPGPLPAAENKMQLGDLLKGAREAGKQKRLEIQQAKEAKRAEKQARRAEIKKSIKDKIDGLVNGTKDKWASFKKTSAEVIDAVDDYYYARREAKQAVVTYARQEIQEAKGVVKERVQETKEAAKEKAAQVANSVRETGREMSNAFKEDVIKPTVETGKAVAQATIKGAETAGLFAVGVGVGAYKLGEAGVTAAKDAVVAVGVGAYEAGKAGVELGVEKAHQGVEAARKWGNEVHEYAQKKAHQARVNTEAASHELSAWVDELKVRAVEAPAKTEDRFMNFIDRIMNGINERRNRRLQRAEQLRASAMTKRASALAVRGIKN